MHRAGWLLWLLSLASCCGLRIDYVATSYSDSDSGAFGVVRRGHFIRVFFTSPRNLARVSAESGLMCVLEIQGQQPVRMFGYVYRDLCSPVWRGMLAYHSWREPDAYSFYGEVELTDGVLEGLAADGEFIVHSPGTFIRCPISNSVVVPQGDLVRSLPN